MTYAAADDRYDSMSYRRTGRSGLDLPAISLGLWHNFGDDDEDQPDHGQPEQALDHRADDGDHQPDEDQDAEESQHGTPPVQRGSVRPTRREGRRALLRQLPWLRPPRRLAARG